MPGCMHSLPARDTVGHSPGTGNRVIDRVLGASVMLAQASGFQHQMQQRQQACCTTSCADCTKPCQSPIQQEAVCRATSETLTLRHAKSKTSYAF